MAPDNRHRRYILGIDLGTTTTKVALIDTETKQIVRTLSRETQASSHSELGSLGNEQDPQKILIALQYCLSGLPKEDLVRVRRIGVAGQMHGVVLWKRGAGWECNEYGRFEVCRASQLFTWQDGRCTPEFLSTLPQPNSHLKLASGLGCCTILWLLKHKKELLDRYDCAGTIQDYVVSMLCGLDTPTMSVHNAASWGYFDTISRTWNTDILSSMDFPMSLLPQVVQAGCLAGSLQSRWYGIDKGTPVGAALGDLQCSIYTRMENTTDAVLNISTSAQLAFSMSPGFIPPRLDSTSAIEYFPYFQDRYLAVAASLTGGNVMAAFVRILQQWTHDLGFGVPESKIWDRLHQISEHESNQQQQSNNHNHTATPTGAAGAAPAPHGAAGGAATNGGGQDQLVIVPTIFGERHNPGKRASVTNITSQNTSLCAVYSALCHGVIDNLHSMMSQDCLLAAGVTRIVGSGTTVLKNVTLQREIEASYKLPLSLCPGSDADAAVGAALAVDKYC